MKTAILLLFLGALAFPATAQTTHGHKQSTTEMANETADQRYVYETERKAKKKKNHTVSTKHKVKVQNKQDRQMRRKKAPQGAR